LKFGADHPDAVHEDGNCESGKFKMNSDLPRNIRMGSGVEVNLWKCPATARMDVSETAISRVTTSSFMTLPPFLRVPSLS